MSDTPLTDAAQRALFGLFPPFKEDIVSAKLARDLERQLAQIKRERDDAFADLRDMEAKRQQKRQQMWEEWLETGADNTRLKRENAELAEKVRGLEQDAKRYRWLADSSGQWWDESGYAACMTGRLGEIIDAALLAEQKDGDDAE